MESLINKEKYYEMIKELSKNKAPKVLMKKQWVDIMIQRVLSARDILKAEGVNKLSTAAIQALKEYDIVHVAGEQRLLRKATTRTDGEKNIVPLDSSFEIVMQAHLSTNHGSCADMNKWLANSKYVVSIICCPVLISSCLKCLLGQEEEHIKHPANDDRRTSCNPSSLTSGSLNKIKQPRAKRASGRPSCGSQPSTKRYHPSKGFVDIIDMSTKPDSNFKYILIYQDVTTMFVLIRPIIGTDLETEVSMELIKMFCDSKPPECLMAKRQLEDFLVSVLERLNVLFGGITSDIGIDDQLSSIVTKKISSWMYRQGTDNWSVGCYFVQWAMNNICNNYATPFERYFNLKRFQDPVIVEVLTKEKHTHTNNSIPIQNPTYSYSLSRTVTDSGEQLTIVRSQELMNKDEARPCHIPQYNLNAISAQEPSTSSIGVESRPSDSCLNQLSQVKNKEAKNEEVEVLKNVPQTSSKTFLPQSCQSNMPSSTPINAPHHNETNSNFDLLDRIMAINPAELLINQPDPDPKIATIDQQIIIDNKINEPESIEVKEIETYICCTCKMEMTTQIYICCICRKSLHLYCGARRKGQNDVVESICFMCMTLQS